MPLCLLSGDSSSSLRGGGSLFKGTPYFWKCYFFFPKRVRDFSDFFVVVVPGELCQLDGGLTRNFSKSRLQAVVAFGGRKGWCSHPFQLPLFYRWEKTRCWEVRWPPRGPPACLGRARARGAGSSPPAAPLLTPSFPRVSDRPPGPSVLCFIWASSSETGFEEPWGLRDSA